MLSQGQWSLVLVVQGNLTQRQILDASKLKESADYYWKVDKNGIKFSKRIENTVRKGEIARYKQFLLFPLCFQKTFHADT